MTWLMRVRWPCLTVPRAMTLTYMHDLVFACDGYVCSATSEDSHYSGLAVPSVTLQVEDPTPKDVSFDPMSLTIDEGGSSTYWLSISPAATSPVTVGVAAESSLVTVSPWNVTFVVGGPTSVEITVSRAENLVDTGNLTDVLVHR